MHRGEFEEKKKNIEVNDKGQKFLNKYTDNSKRVYKSRLKNYLAYRDKDCRELLEELNEAEDTDKLERSYETEDSLNKMINDHKGYGLQQEPYFGGISPCSFRFSWLQPTEQTPINVKKHRSTVFLI
ncbi:MAG: hypothetical protein BTN85_0828 [Candidatus Methanohalarchaeum thermophilum]|uniref:Uncharacterized protein n=1 Tax=Methanohalarchaeum thermophilum TaxID=1903181 RepID=A0A1Q6DVH0_METT1|nr:MAG: hypothetical protein BTN85_0828 [Candidatus Methanohalarchaeum thermophilum]